jgi:hypothetical protein
LQYIAWQHDISVSACTGLMIASQWSVLRQRRCLGALAKSRLANSRRQHCVRLALCAKPLLRTTPSAALLAKEVNESDQA